MTDFQAKVYRAVKNISKGDVVTYKQIAAIIGSPNAYRAVGNALKKNFDPAVPCHRVIKSDGSPGGYNRGPENKLRLLIQEQNNPKDKLD